MKCFEYGSTYAEWEQISSICVARLSPILVEGENKFDQQREGIPRMYFVLRDEDSKHNKEM